jgi:hypothetical protein
MWPLRGEGAWHTVSPVAGYNVRIITKEMRRIVDFHEAVRKALLPVPQRGAAHATAETLEFLLKKISQAVPDSRA